MPIVSPVVSDTNICCINLQLSEAEALGAVAPSLEKRDAGIVKSLYSTANGGPLMVIEDGKEKPSATSSRHAKIKYTKKACDIGDTDAIDPCDFDADEITNPFGHANVRIAGLYKWGFKLSDSELLTMCENRAQFFNTVLSNLLDAAIQGLDKAMMNQLVPLMGKYPNGEESLVTPLTLPVVHANGTPNPVGIALAKTLFGQMNQNGPIVSVGAGYMDIIKNTVGFSTVNDGGINTGAFNLNNFFRDSNINAHASLTGVDNLLTWLAGSIRVVEFYQNAGDHIEKGPMIEVGGQKWYQSERSVVELGGVKWDYFMKRDCGEWVFVFQKEFEVVPMPADAFADCQDYNYAMRFVMGCGDADCTLLEGFNSIVPAEEE